MTSGDKKTIAKYHYLGINLLKGIVWLICIGLIFFLFKTYFGEWYQIIMDRIANKPILVTTTFIFSEIFFGIFPPELFMIWALHQGSLENYVVYTAIFSGISYLAGLVGYFIGFRFSHTPLYLRLKPRFGNQFEKNVKRYGGFMLFIAAVTPIPFSAICMITGASRYSFINFLLISTSRILRFAVYAYAIWGVDKL